jgi:hypothetical protein
MPIAETGSNPKMVNGADFVSHPWVDGGRSVERALIVCPNRRPKDYEVCGGSLTEAVTMDDEGVRL